MRQEGRKTIYSRLTGMNLTLAAVTAALALVGTLTITLRQERRTVDDKLSSSAQIIAQLDLLTPRYTQTAAYGHFGKPELPWERTDQAKILRATVI